MCALGLARAQLVAVRLAGRGARRPTCRPRSPGSRSTTRCCGRAGRWWPLLGSPRSPRRGRAAVASTCARPCCGPRRSSSRCRSRRRRPRPWALRRRGRARDAARVALGAGGGRPDRCAAAARPAPSGCSTRTRAAAARDLGAGAGDRVRRGRRVLPAATAPTAGRRSGAVARGRRGRRRGGSRPGTRCPARPTARSTVVQAAGSLRRRHHADRRLRPAQRVADVVPVGGTALGDDATSSHWRTLPLDPAARAPTPSGSRRSTRRAAARLAGLHRARRAAAGAAAGAAAARGARWRSGGSWPSATRASGRPRSSTGSPSRRTFAVLRWARPRRAAGGAGRHGLAARPGRGVRAVPRSQSGAAAGDGRPGRPLPAGLRVHLAAAAGGLQLVPGGRTVGGRGHRGRRLTTRHR